ncbi:hypothetical protein [Nocardioides sp. LHG3406-4]|uniref:hypothetical protein n=1 Tax=Nocardioides sp. LHG3406-4 TaxID=2804575 RepID=UPI003CF3E2AE
MLRRLSLPREGRLHLAALVVGLLVAGGILVGFARRLYFFGDDWDFLLNRGTVDGADLGLFTPHNEHWSTLPILLFRGLFALFGLDHYLPYALPVILAHLALCALVYLVLVRLGSRPGPALVAALTLAFFGGGAENTLWDFQIGLLAPMTLGFAAVWVWSRWPASPRGVVIAGVLLVLALMCSGVGIAAVVLVASFAALTTGLRSAVAVAAAPTLVFLVWYATVGRTAPTIPVTDRSVYLAVPDYVWTGLTAALEQAAGIQGSGPVLLLVLLAVPFVVRGTSPGVRALAVAGIATAFVQFLLQAWSRVGLGVEQATAPRYAYLTLALFMPTFAMACGWLGRRVQAPRWVAALLVAVVGLGYVVNGVQHQHDFVESRQNLSPDLERLLRGVQAVTAGDEPVLSESPFPTYHPNISVSLLDSPQARAALPQGPVRPRTELDGLALVQVGVGPQSFGLPEATDLRIGPSLAPTGDSDGSCSEYVAGSSGAVIQLASPAEGAEFTVTGGAGFVTTVLERDGLRSLPSVRRVTPGERLHVAVRAPGANLRVSFDKDGAYEICSAD